MKRFHLVFGIAVGICWVGNSLAQNTTAIEPELAGPEYKVQGDYLGKMGADTWGIQVRATGPQQFLCLLRKGGLPGDGWDGQSNAQSQIKASVAGGTASFNGSGWAFSIAPAGTNLTGTGPGGPINFLKVMRTARSLGAKAPAGALVLFDGTDATQFEGQDPAANFDANRKLLRTGETSLHKFKSVRLHVEFRTCYKIFEDDQLRSNSGVLFKDRWEIQVLDSFGKLTLSDQDCGSVYGMFPPKINMAFPPLSWQSFDIDFQDVQFAPDGSIKANPIFTVFYNGVLVHYKQSTIDKGHTSPPYLGGVTNTGNPVIAAAAGFRLQDYRGREQNPVFYRNIWAIENPPDLLDTTWYAAVVGGTTAVKSIIKSQEKNIQYNKANLLAKDVINANGSLRWIRLDGRNQTSSLSAMPRVISFSR